MTEQGGFQAKRFVLHSASGLLLVVLIGVVGCGNREGIGDYQRQKEIQKDAVAELQAIGGKAKEVKRPQGMSWAVHLTGVHISDEVLDQLKDLGYISELNLSKTNVTDAQMQQVNEIGTVLLKLDLSHTAVSDAGLEKLTDLMVLMDLNLTGSKVTPAAVARFKQHRAEDNRFWGPFKTPAIRLK
jgi:hypothetical protein